MSPAVWGLTDTLAGVAVGAIVAFAVARLTTRADDKRAAADREGITLRDLQDALPDAWDATVAWAELAFSPAPERDSQAGERMTAYLQSRGVCDRTANLPEGELRRQAMHFSFVALARLAAVGDKVAREKGTLEDLQPEIEAAEHEYYALRAAISERLSAMGRHRSRGFFARVFGGAG